MAKPKSTRSISISHEVAAEYEALADLIGLGSVSAAIAFTAKQAIPALKAKFTPSADLLTTLVNPPQTPSTPPLHTANCGTAPQSSHQLPQNTGDAPQDSPLAALFSIPVPD